MVITFHWTVKRNITSQLRTSGCFIVSTCKNQLVGCFESDLKILGEIDSSPQFPRYTFRNDSNHHVCHKNYHLQHTKFGRLANICCFATGPYRYLFEAKHLKEVLCFVFLYRKTAIFGFRKCSLEDPSRNWIPGVVFVFFDLWICLFFWVACFGFVSLICLFGPILDLFFWFAVFLSFFLDSAFWEEFPLLKLKLSSRYTSPSCSKLLHWNVFNCKPDSHNQAVFFFAGRHAPQRGRSKRRFSCKSLLKVLSSRGVREWQLQEILTGESQRISPTCPWKISLTIHQQFLKEFLSLFGFVDVWGILLRYLGQVIEQKNLSFLKHHLMGMNQMDRSKQLQTNMNV